MESFFCIADWFKGLVFELACNSFPVLYAVSGYLVTCENVICLGYVNSLSNSLLFVLQHVKRTSMHLSFKSVFQLHTRCQVFYQIQHCASSDVILILVCWGGCSVKFFKHFVLSSDPWNYNNYLTIFVLSQSIFYSVFLLFLISWIVL